VAVVDPIANRRKAYISEIKPLLPFVSGLKVASCAVGDFSVVWAAGSWAPLDQFVNDDGVALVFGDAIERNSSRRIKAAQLWKLWADSTSPAPLDGFHAALSFDKCGKLNVGADLLGVFPVYYYVTEDVILVGSSPELFRYHPCFKTRLDPEGLVGILLTRGLVDGKTLLHGVRRLGAGHLLRVTSKLQASEIVQFRFPMSTKYFDMSLHEQVEVLDNALIDALNRHVPKDEKCCLMLSGGLDSTLLAGYLAQAGYDVFAITEGLETDNEMKCAKQIAKTLGLKHVQFRVGHADYQQYAELDANWQHLSEGFTGVPFWRFYRRLRKEAPRVITGFSGDSILGSLVDRSLSGGGRLSCFGNFFKNINNEAFTPAALGKILKKDYLWQISTTLESIKDQHDRYPGLEFQRTWGFGLNQKTRFNDLSGVWALSFGAWPILPFADHKVLEAAGGFPIESLADRRVERELLRIKFPKLAKQELAGSTLNTVPTTRGFQHKFQNQIYGTTGIWRFEILREIRNQLIIQLRGEKRYWRRQYQFDSPEWRIVRKKAEPYLCNTTTVFRREALEKLMPSVDSKHLQALFRIRTFGVSTTASLRIIYGFAFWLETHFDAVTNLQKSLQADKHASIR
jgi:asparagine synthase (glutamine-hydrolysing)